MTVRCSACTAEIPADAAFCPACGAASGAGAATAEPEGEHRRRLQRALGRKYELGELLGRGGFGEVYAARDAQLEREVAVKALRLELLGSDDLAERFRREARAMAKLRHPHILPIYALGEGQGLAYIIMPRVVGESLRAHLAREGPLPPAEVRRILVELASALAAAHAAGVIHRDLKPENVLLEGDERRALLTDFGIARPTDETGEALTMTGVLLGTPRYMSPEQGAGGREIDHRSDLYSLGVVAFEMLTGHTPFHSTSILGLLARQLADEVPPVAVERPDCPPDLAAAVTRCLAREPDGRWTTAGELQAALGAGFVPPAPASELTARIPLPQAVPQPLSAPRLVPVRRFRVAVVSAVAVLAAAFAIDGLLDDQIGFAPFLATAGVLFLGLEYGLLRSSGLRLRDAVRGAGTSPGTADTAPGPAASTPQLVLLQQAGTERAGVISHLARMAQAERAALGEVLDAVDRTVAHAVSLADRLDTLDRGIAGSRARIERQEAAAATTPAGAGEVARTLIERERDATREAEGRRETLERELERCVAALQEVRLAVARDGATAGPACLETLAGVLAPPDR